MPPHLHYVEPFFGGGAVLFAKPRELIEGHSEVVNDLDTDLTNFWQVLQRPDCFAEFCRLVETIPFSEYEFDSATTYRQNLGLRGFSPCPETAAMFFVRYRQSRQGLGSCFATLSRNRTRRGMNEQVSAWLSAVEGLPAAHERLKRVVILNDDACTVIRQQDGPKTLFYCDPPYLAETRTATDCYGQFEMTEDQHYYLLRTLAKIKGQFLLSGYRSNLYDRWADKHGWYRADFPIDNKASSAKTKPKMVECVWSNFTK